MTNEGEKERSDKFPRSVYLSLGSNLGDREANLLEAVERIEALGLEIVRASSVYESEPVGYKDQPWFLNQVVALRVDEKLTLSENDFIKVQAGEDPRLAADFWISELLKALLDIERAMGRERAVAGGPRVIDIDILLCGEMDCFFVETHGDNVAKAAAPFLILPHPRMHLRRFVLEPLCEIAPNVVHPTLKKTCRELLAALDDRSTVTLYRKDGG